MANFISLPEVQMFEWNWQKSLTYWMLKHVAAARTAASRAFASSAQMTSDVFQLFTPWTDQVLKSLTKSWNLVLQKLLTPVIGALKKLNDLRAGAWSVAFDIVEKIAFAGEGAVKWLVTPLVEIVERIRKLLLNLRYIARMIAARTELDIFEAETRTHDSTGDVATQIDELSSWLDHILDETGLLQPRILLRSVWAYMGALVALLVNGGIFGKPKELFAELLEAFPFPDGSTVLTDLTAGKMGPEENIEAALDTLNRWVR